MSKKVSFDAKGHEAILDALRRDFDLVVAPRGQYLHLRSGKLAGWLTATKKHVRVRIGGGTSEAVNVDRRAGQGRRQEVGGEGARLARRRTRASS